jgi:hypothetical protein
MVEEQNFTASGTFSVPSGVTSVDVLVVAGGGGGGKEGGGGGAGGLIHNATYSVTPLEDITVTVGSGGAGQTSAGNGATGQNSVFGTLTASGGGGGGGWNVVGSNGGSGGGGGIAHAGGTGSAGQGYAGGTGSASNGFAGGGGGASEVGSNAVDNSGGGAGGDGTSVFGTVYAGGGGGGTSYLSASAAPGGSGGGGAGGVRNGAGSNATANSGGGGGGGGSGATAGNGGNGGSGIVRVQWVAATNINVSDTVTLTDVFSSNLIANNVNAVDTATLTDTFTFSAGGYKNISETATLTDTFSQKLTRQLSITDSFSLSDSVALNIHIPPSGVADKDTFFVSDGTTWYEFPNFDYFKIKKIQNSISEFELTVSDISTAQKSYFKEQAEILFFIGETMKLKGRINTITYKDAYTVEAKGEGMECKLSDKQFIVSGDSRVQYDNTSAKDIFTEINSNILTTNSGIFASDYGNISMRYEYANRLTALASTVDAIDYYWWISQTSSDEFATNYLNVSSTQGATASAKTFDLTNCEFEQERDTTNLVNYVYGLGYGDGINQLSTYVYAASTQSSFLSANISATDTSIPVINGSIFNATGSARIAKEVLTYAGISSNTLTGCARPTDGSAKAHNKLCYIEQHYLTSSAQTGSSINTYGIKDYSLIDKTILNEETLEVIASGYLSDRKEVIQSITIKSDDALSDATLNIGDLVTATSSESNLNGDYHIVSQEFIDDHGELSLVTEISNRSAAFISALQQTKKAEENAAKYMQGATNIYAISEAENCDSTHYLNMRFFIPNEAIAINKVLLNFNLENYRAYETGNAGTVATISDYATDTFAGTMSTSTWEDTGGEVSVDVGTGEKVLIIYSCGLDQAADPPISERDLKVQKKIGAGAYADLTGSIAYWVPGENSATTSTSYYNIPGSEFKHSLNTDLWEMLNGTFYADGDTIISSPVHLPNGSVVTGVNVYGNDTTETYTLLRKTANSTANSTMATANINTEDTTISNATIDNENYNYFFVTSTLNDGDIIYGARVNYTQSVAGDLSSTYNLTLAKSILDTASSTGSISYKVQVNGNAGDKFGELGSGTITAIVFSNASHTHSLGYGIYEEDLVSPTASVYTGIDGGSMTLKGAYTSSQIELDLTTESAAVGAGNWMDIQFRPNKNMRIEANAYVQIFIKSE